MKNDTGRWFRLNKSFVNVTYLTFLLCYGWRGRLKLVYNCSISKLRGVHFLWSIVKSKSESLSIQKWSYLNYEDSFFKCNGNFFKQKLWFTNMMSKGYGCHEVKYMRAIQTVYDVPRLISYLCFKYCKWLNLSELVPRFVL